MIVSFGDAIPDIWTIERAARLRIRPRDRELRHLEGLRRPRRVARAVRGLHLGRRHHVRHVEHLPGRRGRDRPRQAARQGPGRLRGDHEVQRREPRAASDRDDGQQPQVHGPVPGGEPAPPGHRLRGRVHAALPRRGYPDRGDRGGPRRPRPRWQGALRRALELPGLAGRRRRRPDVGPDRHRDQVQPGRPHRRARAAADGRGIRARLGLVLPAGRGPAHRQVSPRREGPPQRGRPSRRAHPPSRPRSSTRSSPSPRSSAAPPPASRWPGCATARRGRARR